MKQIVIDDPLKPGESIELSGDPFHHLCRVRRAGRGDRVTALSLDDGISYRVRLDSVGRNRCTLYVEERLADTGSRAGETPLIVYVAPLKGKRSDAVIRQLTELGVDAIGIVNTERTVAKVDPAQWKGRASRLESIIREAVEQSGRRSVPRLLAPITVDELPGDGVLFHEESYSEAALDRAVDEARLTGIVSIATGPEGGFSQREVDSLRARRWTAVTLPFPVLRAETAAISAATLVLYTLKHYSTTVQERIR